MSAQGVSLFAALAALVALPGSPSERLLRAPAVFTQSPDGVAHGVPAHAGPGGARAEATLAELLQAPRCDGCCKLARTVDPAVVELATAGQGMFLALTFYREAPGSIETAPAATAARARHHLAGLRARDALWPGDSGGSGTPAPAEFSGVLSLLLTAVAENADLAAVSDGARARLLREAAHADVSSRPDGPLAKVRRLAGCGTRLQSSDLQVAASSCDGTPQWVRRVTDALADSPELLVSQLADVDPALLLDTAIVGGGPLDQRLAAAWRHTILAACAQVPHWWRQEVDRITGSACESVVVTRAQVLRRWPELAAAFSTPAPGLLVVPTAVAAALTASTTLAEHAVLDEPLTAAQAQILSTLAADALSAGDDLDAALLLRASRELSR